MTKAEERKIEKLMRDYFYSREEAIKSIERDKAYIKYCKTERKDFWERRG